MGSVNVIKRRKGENILDLEMIYKISSYEDKETGLPGCASALIKAKMSQNGLLQEETSIDLNTPLIVQGTGGCTIVTLLFKKTDRGLFNRAAKICMGWLCDKETEDALFFNISPLYFQGALTVILQHLVYCDFYETKTAIKLILAFDGTKTSLALDENFDIESIKKEIDTDIRKELSQLDRELLAEQAEQREIEDQISQSIIPDYNDLQHIISPDTETEEDTVMIDENTRYRSSEEDF